MNIFAVQAGSLDSPWNNGDPCLQDLPVQRTQPLRTARVEPSLFKEHLGTWSITIASCLSQALRIK